MDSAKLPDLTRYSDTESEIIEDLAWITDLFDTFDRIWQIWRISQISADLTG